MQVQVLRWIDYWAGIPLCFILSFFAVIGRFLRGKAGADRPVKKILIIKLAELGAVILAYPCLKEIKRTYPDATIHVLTFRRNKAIFSLLEGLIDDGNIRIIDDTSWFSMCLGFMGCMTSLFKERFDLVLDLEFYSRIGSVLSFFSIRPQGGGILSVRFRRLVPG